LVHHEPRNGCLNFNRDVAGRPGLFEGSCSRKKAEGVELSKGRASVILRQRGSLHLPRGVLNGATSNFVTGFSNIPTML
jgi:hypothetical protein